MDTPPITRTYMIASLAMTFALQFDFVSQYQLFLYPKLIFTQHQYWRLITTFLYLGDSFDYNYLFNFIFTSRYCRMLEDGHFRNQTADFFYMFLVGGSLMLVLGYLDNLMYLGPSLTMMLVYIWSRKNPDIRMNLFGLVTFRAPYLPWALLGISIILSGSFDDEVIGIVVGHFYYFFKFHFPNEPHGFKMLETPRFIKNAFELLGFDQPTEAEDAPEAEEADRREEERQRENANQRPDVIVGAESDTTTRNNQDRPQDVQERVDDRAFN